MERDVETWKRELLKVFRKYIEICDAHGLNWFCAAGTAIGAIRHHGFIPWDDDIDVMMPRPDYDRFTEICLEEKPEGFEIVTPETTPGYYLFFNKFCNSRITLLERRPFRCIYGAYVDVFPLDGAALDRQGRMDDRRLDRWKRILKAASMHCSAGDYLDLAKGGYWGTLKNALWTSFDREGLRRKALGIIRECRDRIPYGEAEYVEYFNLSYRHEIFPKRLFESYVEFPFEDLTVRLNNGYDEYLRFEFGDYMTPPPQNKRRSNHKVAYVNLDGRESLEEVLKKIY